MIALAHGTSDGQKTMGVITLVLITAGYQESGTGPQTWVIAAAGLAIGLGTYSGGWRIMRTMGKGLVDLQAAAGLRRGDHLRRSHSRVLAHGLRAVHHPGLLRLGHRLRGRPEARRTVRWGTARRMVYGWLLTLPAAALFGGDRRRDRADRHRSGVIIVFARAAVPGPATIFAISRRAAVTRHNVNDSRDVTVKFGRVATETMLATVATVAATTAAASAAVIEPTTTDTSTTAAGPATGAISPIIIARPTAPPVANEPTNSPTPPSPAR